LAPTAFGVAIAAVRVVARIGSSTLLIAATISILVAAGFVIAKLLRTPSLRLGLVYVAIWSVVSVLAWIATEQLLAA
jgi:hypothetical protein